MKDLTKQEHYTNNGIEPIEIMRKNFSHDEFVGFCKGNVLKYLLRYKDKNGIEDLEKAKIYLDWLIGELVAEDLNKTFDERFAEIEREEQEKCSCGCHCKDCKDYDGCEDGEGCSADCKGHKGCGADGKGDKGFDVQLTLFDNEPMTLFDDEPSEEPLTVVTNEFKETDLTNDEKSSNFEKYLVWKQALDELRKSEQPS